MSAVVDLGSTNGGCPEQFIRESLTFEDTFKRTARR